MAVPVAHVYRYKARSLNAGSLSGLVPGPIILGETGPSTFVDVTALDTGKEDLDAVMASLGWDFVSTDPTTTPAQDASSSLLISPHLSKDVSAGGTFVLTAAEASRRFIVLTGTLLASATIEFPATDGADWVVRNAAVLGVFTVSLNAAGSASPILLPSGTLHVWCDGTDLLKVSELAV